MEKKNRKIMIIFGEWRKKPCDVQTICLIYGVTMCDFCCCRVHNLVFSFPQMTTKPKVQKKHKTKY